jgi:hypothetical protein
MKVPDGGEGTEADAAKIRRKAEAERLLCRNAAASLAAGALSAITDALSAPNPASGHTDGEGSGRGEGDAEVVDKRARASFIHAEKAFAEETLARILGPKALGNGLPVPLRSLAEALYPHEGDAEASKAIYLSSRELRARLAEAERPGGPGPKSREAFVLRSLLGAELWDSGGWDAVKEAIGLLKKASSGLDRLAGAGSPDSLAAKERLARRLGGMSGYGSVLPTLPMKPSPDDVRASAKHFRALVKLAPPEPEGEPLRNRALTALGALSGKEGDAFARLTGSVLRMMFKGQSGTGLDAEDGRSYFDMAESMYRLGKKEDAAQFHSISLNARRNVLGGRHPETVSSLARIGDKFYFANDEVGACNFWAIALEALEPQGERGEPFAADLELRIGRELLHNGDFTQAIIPLRRAEERLRRMRGEGSQRALECAAYLADACFEDGEVKEAERIFRSLSGLLDGTPPRSDPDPSLPSDEALLSLALAGTGATMILSGDPAGGEALLRRSAEIRARPNGGDSDVDDIGDMYRERFLKPASAAKAVRPDGFVITDNLKDGPARAKYTLMGFEDDDDDDDEDDYEDDGDGDDDYEDGEDDDEDYGDDGDGDEDYEN